MSYKGSSLTDRRDTAASAKRAMLEKFRAKVADPSLAEKVAAYEAIAVAREIRVAERKAVRDAEEAARKAEEARLAAEEAARQAALEVERVAQEEALKVQQKAARDARYAARKARKKR